ncbi:DUF1853 family protein [Agarilytica rhodophyticola]|uniref:DUF1853 family protein n=1 Tax=Agarilytica rhodophyticola TaxID=1737490 RepID=UPI000B34911A|nr:DUF1853 family protein [Agarilytica rhodophyticola]
MLNIPYRFANKWLKYKHPVVRDLAWLLLSPSMLDGKLAHFDAFTINEPLTSLLPWLENIDRQWCQDPQSTPDIIARDNFRRLGLYAEALLAFYFQHANTRAAPYRLLARNIQINRDKTTLGECDFFIENTAGEIIHIELAVKYYLQINCGHQLWHHWLGPNTKDRLDIKLNRMMDHQLALPHKDFTQSALEDITNTLGIKGKRLISRHLIKGYLFGKSYGELKSYLHDDINTTQQMPLDTSQHALKGTWMHYSAFLKQVKKHAYEVLFCEKMEWFVGPERQHTLHCPAAIEKRIQEILEHAARVKKTTPPTLLLIRNGTQTSERFIPVMLVADHWPETSTPSRSM